MEEMIVEAVNMIYEPFFYRLQSDVEREDFKELLRSNFPVKVFDQIDNQLKELIKCTNPSLQIKPEEYPGLIKEHLNGRNADGYGVWVYYPWNQNLVHILDEDEFIEVRTNRNRNKITKEEQATLKQKKIGIVGLSVGQSIALTMAMERTCGEIRLADFDTAELSNLNRLRTGLHNLGLNKAVIAAREIAEIDPFIKVKIFDEGLNPANMDSFFTEDGKLDLLVEVCDGLEIKIESRQKARELKIPVVMDTNDRGMLDVERFDLEPKRPLLHGLLGEVNIDGIQSMDSQEKLSMVLKIVGADTISERLQASLKELGKTIGNLPQLASSVVLGGAITTEAARMILLDQHRDSGRYYIDIETIINDEINITKG